MSNWTKSDIAVEFQIAQDKGFLPLFAISAQKYNIPIALLLGIASRESNMGRTLDSSGKGDNGNGWGLMQVDKRAHPVFTSQTSPFDHAKIIDYGAKVWVDNYKIFNDMRLATIAYNRGAGTVRTAIAAGRNPENGYGIDTLNRMRSFEELLTNTSNNGGSSASLAKTWLNIGALVGIAGIGYAIENGAVKLPNLLKLWRD